MNTNDMPSWKDVEGRAVSLIDKGHMLQRLDGREEALANFEKAVTICRPISEKSDPVALVMAQALDNKANALVDLKRLSEVIPCFDEAIRIHKEIMRGDGTWQDVRETAVTVMNKGRALMLLGHHDEARICFEQALDDFDRCKSDEDLARAWLNRGELDVRQDHLDEALAAFEESTVRWEAVIGDEPNTAKSDYAYTLSSRADVLLMLRRYDEAIDSSDRSISLHRIVLNHTKSRKERRDLAEALNRHGHILTELGRTEEAQRCFREAAKLK
jgi:tetratricopeptide (TPR) repeat protein